MATRTYYLPLRCLGEISLMYRGTTTADDPLLSPLKSRPKVNTATLVASALTIAAKIKQNEFSINVLRRPYRLPKGWAARAPNSPPMAKMEVANPRRLARIYSFRV
jgi:hypothetical protein